MKTQLSQYIERFCYLMLPIAVFIGCAGGGEPTKELPYVMDNMLLFNQGLNTVTIASQENKNTELSKEKYSANERKYMKNLNYYMANKYSNERVGRQDTEYQLSDSIGLGNDG